MQGDTHAHLAFFAREQGGGERGHGRAPFLGLGRVTALGGGWIGLRTGMVPNGVDVGRRS